MVDPFIIKPQTDIGDFKIELCAPSGRGKGTKLTARHKGRTVPKAVTEANGTTIRKRPLPAPKAA